ncbi:MAG: lasso peptide biosynthesis B2 protein [Pseudomonadota bacterium]
MKVPFEVLSRKTRQVKLYFQAWLSLVMVRMRLSSKGYAYFENSPVEVGQRRVNVNPGYVAHVVKRVSRMVPGALCLAQAVTAQRMLANLGYETKMRIGVKTDDSGALEAHAWLIFDDRVILGGDAAQLEEYQVMTDMTSATTS